MVDISQTLPLSFAEQAKTLVQTAAEMLNNQNGTKLELRPASLKNGPLSAFDQNTAVFVLAQKRTGFMARVLGVWQGVAAVVVRSGIHPYGSERGHIVNVDVYRLRDQTHSIGSGALGVSKVPATAPSSLAPDIANNIQWAFDAGLLKQPKIMSQPAAAVPA